MTVLHYTDTRNNSSNHVVIKKPLFSIGRQKPCDLQLNDSSVDAIHMNSIGFHSVWVHFEDFDGFFV